MHDAPDDHLPPAPPIPLLVLIGQTASGKEQVSLRLAERLGGEIVSLDSMKVYRGLDLGTAKASPEDRRRVTHHLLDVADPWERFSAARWLSLAEPAIRAIVARGRQPIVSGGTILYLKALLFGLFAGPAANDAIRARLTAEAETVGLSALHRRLESVDPAAGARIHPNDLRRIVRALEVYELTGRTISEQQQQFGQWRPDYAPLIVALRRTREDLHQRIERRVERMVELGLEAEVRRLLAEPRGLSPEATQAVGYHEMIDLVQGRLSPGAAVEAIKQNTRVFARKQMTHLRSLKNRQWLDLAPHEEPAAAAERVVQLWRAPA